MIILGLAYYYNGSFRSAIQLNQLSDGTVEIFTSKGELIANVDDGYELRNVINNLVRY